MEKFWFFVILSKIKVFVWFSLSCWDRQYFWKGKYIKCFFNSSGKEFKDFWFFDEIIFLMRSKLVWELLTWNEMTHIFVLLCIFILSTYVIHKCIRWRSYVQNSKRTEGEARILTLEYVFYVSINIIRDEGCGRVRYRIKNRGVSWRRELSAPCSWQTILRVHLCFTIGMLVFWVEKRASSILTYESKMQRI